MLCEHCGNTADEVESRKRNKWICTGCAPVVPVDHDRAYTPPIGPCLKFTVDIVPLHGL